MRFVYLSVTLFSVIALPQTNAWAQAEKGPCMESKLEEKAACLNVRLGRVEGRLLEIQKLAEQAQEVAAKALQTAEQAHKAAAEAQNTANNAIPNGAGVSLASGYSAIKKCLWQPGFDNVNAVDCGPDIWWRLDIRRRP